MNVCDVLKIHNREGERDWIVGKEANQIGRQAGRRTRRQIERHIDTK